MHTHSGHQKLDIFDPKYVKIALVGRPNVGKSSLFYVLTGRYTTISNYPGTTVDITLGKKGDFIFIDTPGIYSLIPSSYEEYVTRRIIEQADIILHIVDAKNLANQLLLTLEMIEAGLNVILILNMVDEAEARGIEIDDELLSGRLGIPVVKTVAVEGRGVKKIMEVLTEALKTKQRRGGRIFKFSPKLEEIIKSLEHNLEGTNLTIDTRMACILALLGDRYTIQKLGKNLGIDLDRYVKSNIFRHTLVSELIYNLNLILDGVIKHGVKTKGLKAKLDILTLNPVWGVLLAILSLLFIYYMAGVIGAQILVDEFEGFFEENINPYVNQILDTYIPNYWVRELFGGEYGIITLAIRYAVAIVLPIVSIFFLSFSILEDSGILPRTAYLLDSILKKIGLSGKAAIPLILGTGCGTMAILTTRILGSKRERIISAIILSIGVPCSAQLGLIIAVAPDFQALMTWFTILLILSLFVGLISSRIIPGRAPLLYMEIPPLRIPRIKNIVLKTYSRMRWYVTEIIPIFIAVSIFIWIGRLTGLFDILISALSMPVSFIGLPPDASKIFLYGFFRRDYGAAGLYDLVSEGILNYLQILTAMVTLTLFVPCVAMFAMMWKEFGLKYAVAILLIAFTISFTIGFLVFNLLGMLI